MTKPQTIGERPAEPENVTTNVTVPEVPPAEQSDHQRAEESPTEDTLPSEEPQAATAPDNRGAEIAAKDAAPEAAPIGMEPVTPAPSEPHNDGRPKQAVRSAKKKHATKSVGVGKGNTAKKAAAAAGSSIPAAKTTTNVVVSNPLFSHSIIIPPAIDALFGMTTEERIAEVKRVCERDEVEALNSFVAPLTHWMNDLDYVLDNYGDVVDVLADHFNKQGRPQAKRATWGDLNFDSETLKYVDVKFGYKPEMAISWAGICHVFFNRSIRTMQRRKAYKAMLTSGETVVSPKPTNKGGQKKKGSQLQSTSGQASLSPEDEDCLRTGVSAARRYFEAQEAGKSDEAEEAKQEFLVISKMDSVNSQISGDRPNYKFLLIDLLSQVEKVGDRLPVALTRMCHEIRKRLGIDDASFGLKPEDRKPAQKPPDVAKPESTTARTQAKKTIKRDKHAKADGNGKSECPPMIINGLHIIKRKDGKCVVLDPTKEVNNTVAICDDLEKAVAAAKKKKPEQAQSAQADTKVA